MTQDIQAIIEQRKDTYLQWLVRLCRQPSIAAQNEGMAETAALVEEMLRELGVQARQVPTSGYPVVYGDIGEGSKTLLFYNHYDVQPPEPLDEWQSPPFAAEVRDGALYARGVADNKGNIVARIAALDAYLRARGNLPFKVKFIIEGEEEIGSPHIGEFAEGNRDLVQADACIWEAGYSDPSGRREIALGVKGILYVELEARTANVDLHSMWATVVPNAAWRLTRALQTLKDATERVLIPGFYDAVQSPTEADLAALRRMPFEADARREQWGLTAFNNDLDGLALLKQHVFQPTCNIAGIESGYTGRGMKTVLPHRAVAKLDFRLVPDQDPHAIFALLRDYLAQQGFGDIEVRMLSAEHPARTPIDHPFARLVEEVTREVSGTDPVVYPLTPATGPMYALCARYGIPTVSVGVGHAASRVHAPNENILLSDFYLGIAQIAAIIDRFGNPTP
jgi:acetylornithine deacetylase/succinyl-diaminopimelate desuccinylase-like protein